MPEVWFPAALQVWLLSMAGLICVLGAVAWAVERLTTALARHLTAIHAQLGALVEAQGGEAAPAPLASPEEGPRRAAGTISGWDDLAGYQPPPPTRG
jgi:hypothetical protein